jgi:hypothetical protein
LKQEPSQETETQSEDSLTFNEYQTSEFSLEHNETRPIDIILEAATSSTNNHERQNLEHQNISSQKFSPNKILPPVIDHFQNLKTKIIGINFKK